MSPLEPTEVRPVDHHQSGLEHWRSIEQLADSPEMHEVISKEFPGYDAKELLNTSRRRFLKLMGASMALAGISLTGCRRWPKETLAPYASQPRDRTPGVPEQFATVWELNGVATGLLVTSFDGRPIKVEGNPSHPFAWTVKDKLGSADAFAQASVLELYDPQRSRTVINRKGRNPKDAVDSTWEKFVAAVQAHFHDLHGKGEGFAILSEASEGPSVADLKKRLLAAYPQAKWYEYEPLSSDGHLEGSRAAFGKPVRTYLHLDKASTVVLLDDDVIGTHPAHIRYAADWATRRRSADSAEHREMSRVYMAESGFSLTGTICDVRLPTVPTRIYVIAREIAAGLGVAGATATGEQLTTSEQKFVTAAIADLKKAGNAGVVSAGSGTSVETQALAHAINQSIGAVGNTVTLLQDPAGDRPTHAKAIADLAGQITAGKINTLVILGGNPAYDAPTDLKFADAIARVPMSIRLGLYDDETSLSCKWHVPRAHYLEAWGDARAWDGTASIVQPLILPLYGGKSPIELLAVLAGDEVTDGRQIVRRTWQSLIKGNDFEPRFRKALESGVLPDSAYAAAADAKVQLKDLPAPAPRPAGFFLRFDPDYRTFDGRFANNAWLQETPDPLTKLTWDNAALMAKADADKLGLKNGDFISIGIDGGDTTEMALYVLAGQPAGVITLPLGYGRYAAGNVGNKLGFNTYRLRTTKGMAYGVTTRVASAGGSYDLALTQNHHIIDTIGYNGREKRVGGKGESGKLIHETTFAKFKAEPRSALGRTVPLNILRGDGQGQLFEPPSLFAGDKNNPHAWGMAVDMNTCIGCNACAVACQAENNIPVVGKHEVMNHREMNWLRIDRYFKGSPEDENVEVVYQPMMCVHCENAPCEQVCPVAATVHDTEGINTMVYNRCIGTRYCSNNCPYKVRRFNYFDYHSKDPRKDTADTWLNVPDTQQNEVIDKIKRMVFNPDVTVRMRGVMEKCTYCVQRIHGATIDKRGKGEKLNDGDIVTACQQACPTQAIVFGDLLDPNSKVVQLQKSQRAYGVLQAELNTRPRTKYLAKLRNPNDGAPTSEHHG